MYLTERNTHVKYESFIMNGFKVIDTNSLIQQRAITLKVLMQSNKPWSYHYPLFRGTYMWNMQALSWTIMKL